jgi:hypothetical protein
MLNFHLSQQQQKSFFLPAPQQVPPLSMLYFPTTM